MSPAVPFSIIAGALRTAELQERIGIDASARYGLAPSAKDYPGIAAILVAALAQQQRQADLLADAHAWLALLAPHEPLVRALIERADIRAAVAQMLSTPAEEPRP